MQLEHSEMITLARLLGHHVGGTGYGPLDVIAQKLLEYADNMGENVQPLQLRASKIAGYPERLGFRCDTLAPGN